MAKRLLLVGMIAAAVSIGGAAKCGEPEAPTSVPPPEAAPITILRPRAIYIEPRSDAHELELPLTLPNDDGRPIFGVDQPFTGMIVR